MEIIKNIHLTQVTVEEKGEQRSNRQKTSTKMIAGNLTDIKCKWPG